ncbi:MAG: ABC transporter substrate-binding protein, partial [Bacillota bacterium]
MLSVLLLTFVLASCAGKPPAKEKEEVTVRVAIAPGVVHLDAQDTNTRYAFEVTQLCYENLFERDKDGKLQPWLVSDWSVSGDGLVYTFHVREGVKFHDGTPLDAEAVKVNLERKIQRDQPLASMLKPYLQEMRVTGPMTLELRFNKPMFDLPGILAAKTFAIYSPKALREQQPEWFKENMVGTGPFILKEYRKGEYAKFVRNP